MKKVYIAASFAYADRTKTESRKIDIERIVGKVKEKLNADFYIPHQLKIENAWDMSLEDWARKVYEHDIGALNSADLVIFISYGKENNSGSVWECGYAYAKAIPIVVVKMTDEAESLMVSNTVRAIIRESDIETYDFESLPKVIVELNKLS
jgi:nucleoside deoxyribosyltransferase